MKISAGKVVIPIRAAPQARPIRTELRMRSLPWFWWSLLNFFFFLFLSDVFFFSGILSWPEVAADVFLEYEGRGDRFKKSLRVGQVTGHGLENLASRRLGELCWTFSSGLQLDVYLGWPCCIVEIELPYGAVSSNDSVSVLQSFRVAYLWYYLYFVYRHNTSMDKMYYIYNTLYNAFMDSPSFTYNMRYQILYPTGTWSCSASVLFLTQHMTMTLGEAHTNLMVDKSHCEDGDRSLQISCIGASCPHALGLPAPCSPVFHRDLIGFCLDLVISFCLLCIGTYGQAEDKKKG